MIKFNIILIFLFLVITSYAYGQEFQKENKLTSLKLVKKNIKTDQGGGNAEKQGLEVKNIPSQEVKGVRIDLKIGYKVVRVVDGDTIDVNIDDKIQRIRMIGINTPESVDPRRQVECFGKEASDKAKEMLLDKNVVLEKDLTQDEKDKYGRLLRYVKTKEGLFYNLEIIKLGYAYEYTYRSQYKHQNEFKNAQKTAQSKKLGLWADGVCGEKNAISNPPMLNSTSTINLCNIKGNINSKKEKIYHLPKCSYYKQTVIDESVGEKWFCSEPEAINAGWRKAGNCL